MLCAVCQDPGSLTLTLVFHVHHLLNMTTSTTTDLKAFPPISDVGSAIKNIDWDLLKKRSQRDINQIGMVLATTGEFIHDVGVRLADAKF